MLVGDGEDSGRRKGQQNADESEKLAECQQGENDNQRVQLDTVADEFRGHQQAVE